MQSGLSGGGIASGSIIVGWAGRMSILVNSRENYVPLFSLDFEKKFQLINLVSKEEIDRQTFTFSSKKMRFLFHSNL